jgi:SAM-dependent methyltransferase
LSVFGTYAQYYDLLYAGKDYAKEVDYVRAFIRRYAPGASSVLELGCGTGVHASLFAEHGYAVTGIDLSGEMLARARERHPTLIAGGVLSFQQGDIRDFDLGEQFDVVIALFHVISYLPNDHDLGLTFASISKHLKPAGLFLFDYWYGPAVLADPPTHRIKTLENDEIEVTRVATPTLHPADHLVDVNYDMTIVEKSSGRLAEFSETHRMHYLFRPEIESLLVRQGLRPLEFREWLSEKEPDEKSWNGFVVAKKPS